MIDFWISTGLIPKLSNVEFSVVSSAYKTKENLALLSIISLINSSAHAQTRWLSIANCKET